MGWLAALILGVCVVAAFAIASKRIAEGLSKLVVKMPVQPSPPEDAPTPSTAAQASSSIANIPAPPIHKPAIGIISNDSVLAPLVNRTIGQLERLLVVSRTLAHVASQVKPQLELKFSEAGSDQYQSMYEMAREVDSLLGALRILSKDKARTPPMISRFFDFESAIDACGAPLGLWINESGSYMGPFHRLDGISFVDELASLVDSVEMLYDKWTRVGDLQQSLCDVNAYVAIHPWTSKEGVESLLGDKYLKDVVSRVAEGNHTPTDADTIKNILGGGRLTTVHCPHGLKHAVSLVAMDRAVREMQDVNHRSEFIHRRTVRDAWDTWHSAALERLGSEAAKSSV